MHIKPDKGILFLILPSRCINSKHVGRMVHFIELLHGFNLVEVLPRRITPKLIFFILSYKKINNNDSRGIIISQRNIDDNDKYDADNYNNSDDNNNWIEKLRNVWKDIKNNKKYKYFLQDLSHIPSNEFAISLPNDFIQ
jgi:hypothetical protein